MPAAGAAGIAEFAPGRWALALPPPGSSLTPALARAAAARLASSGPGPAPGPLAITRTRLLDGRLGPAVLITRPGQVIIYCPAAEITARAAAALAALGSCAALAWPGPCPPGSRIEVTRDPHPGMAGGRHPAYISARAGITAHVCANLISAELAAALSELCTAWARRPLAGPAPA